MRIICDFDEIKANVTMSLDDVMECFAVFIENEFNWDYEFCIVSQSETVDYVAQTVEAIIK